MKKTLLIIFILSIIFLAGCGLFNLNYFIMPNDAEFLALIEELDTPEKICRYMQENFAWEYHFSAYSPYQMWLANAKTKAGDCNDFACFGVFIAHYHGYETYQIKIHYSGTIEKHCIAVYVEDDGLSFTDCQYYLNNYGYFFNTFRQIVEFDCKYYPGCELKRFVVYDYAMNVVEMESIK